MGEEVFVPRPTGRTTIRTIVYLPKEDVSKTMKLLSDTPGSRDITTVFKPYSVTTAPSSPSGFQPIIGSKPESTLPYRFASIERLVQRQKIYDNNSCLPVVANFDDTPVEYTYSVSVFSSLLVLLQT